MKTGYVYILSVRTRLGRVLRIGTSLRHPSVRLERLARGGRPSWRPKLIGYEFAEDLLGARAQLRALIKSRLLPERGHSYRLGAPRARSALARLAARLETLRKPKFHPRTGLIIDPDLELAGPILEFSEAIAAGLRTEAGGDLAKLDMFLHPYLIGAIAARFRQEQPRTKIPDAYWPEILKDVAWRLWRCRLKPRIFVRLSALSAQERGYMELARFSTRRPKLAALASGPRGYAGTEMTPAAAFLRAPAEHLSETMSHYIEALDRVPSVKLRNGLFRIAQASLAVAGIFVLDAMLSGTDPGRWPNALLLLFFSGAAVLAFNLYDKPDLTRGLALLSRKQVLTELERVETQGVRLP